MCSLMARGYLSYASEMAKNRPGCIIKTAHVPANGYCFFYVQFHEPLDQKDAFFSPCP